MFLDVEPLLTSVVEGYNVCIMAYGQTGSGKTHTMVGNLKAEGELGISPRVMQQLLQYQTGGGNKYAHGGEPLSISMSMVEIYNDKIYDLLAPSVSVLDIRLNHDKEVYLPGLKEVQVDSLATYMQWFKKGSSGRVTNSTGLNADSSRSHLVIMIDVVSASRRGRVTLVDLAGSERVHKSLVSGAVLKETQFINKSLSSLIDVLEALREKSKHVPFRNSPLTFLLQDSLKGNSRTTMIFNVHSSDMHYEETASTLALAAKVTGIKIAARPRLNLQVNKLADEAIKRLEKELAEAHSRNSWLERELSQLHADYKVLSTKQAALLRMGLKVSSPMKSSKSNTNSKEKVEDQDNVIHEAWEGGDVSSIHEDDNSSITHLPETRASSAPKLPARSESPLAASQLHKHRLSSNGEEVRTSLSKSTPQAGSKRLSGTRASLGSAPKAATTGASLFSPKATPPAKKGRKSEDNIRPVVEVAESAERSQTPGRKQELRSQQALLEHQARMNRSRNTYKSPFAK